MIYWLAQPPFLREIRKIRKMNEKHILGVKLNKRRELVVTPELYRDLRWLKFFLLLSLFLFFVSHTIREGALDRAFYTDELARLAVVTHVNESHVAAANRVIEYLDSGRPLPDYFSSRDRLHMKDVRSLYLFVLRTEYISILLSLILVYLIFIHKRDEVVKSLSHAVMLAGIALSSFAVVLFIMGIYFPFFFIKFHELVFTNNYWILIPGRDLLIELFPLRFFYDITSLIIRRIFFSGLILAVMGGAAFAYSLKGRKMPMPFHGSRRASHQRR